MNIDAEINNKLNYIENQYALAFGKKPSKTDILKILADGFGDKKIARKPKSRDKICFLN
jgi:hypothetical protein